MNLLTDWPAARFGARASIGKAAALPLPATSSAATEGIAALRGRDALLDHLPPCMNATGLDPAAAAPF